MSKLETLTWLWFYRGCIIVMLSGVIQTTKAQPNVQKIDSLIKIAQGLSANNPQSAIAAATEAYRESSKITNGGKALKSLNLIAFIYLGQRDFKKAHIIASQGLEASKKYRIRSLSGDFWNLNGYIFVLENDYDSAIVNYLETLPYYQKDNLLKRIGNIYLAIGICELKLSRFKTANAYYFKSADVFLKLKDTTALSNTYNAIAQCFSSLSRYNLALQYHKKALTLRLKLKDKALIAQSYNNLGFAFKQNNQPDSAINYLSKCLAMRQHQKDSSILVLTLQNMGSSYQMKGKLGKGKAYVLRSLKIASNYQMKEEQARGYLDLAKIYLAEQNYQQAQAALNFTETTASELKLTDLLMDCFAVRADLYEQTGDFKKSLLYFKKKTLLHDTLFTDKNNRTISELEISYKTSERERHIAALNLKANMQQVIVTHQQRSIWLLAVAAVLLLLLIVMLYNSFRNKNLANRRIQLLMKELHHRVKNNLMVLAGLFKMQIESLIDENMKSALRENETRLTSMNLIHNKLYLDDTTTKIEMGEYLGKLMHHIRSSFGGKNISLLVNVDIVMVEADKAVAIGLIVNELVTNAFKYAFEKNCGEISLTLKQENKSKLRLTLADNGIGFKPNEPGKSFGLRLVNLMARQLDSALIVKNGAGTCYEMDINV